jgi:hypothetical protein
VRRPVRAGGLVVATLAVAGCGSPAPSGGSPAATLSAPAGTSSPVASSSAGSPVPSISIGPVASVEADPGLFAVIGGDSSDGLVFQYDPDTTATVAADPGLARDAVGLAIGLYTVRGQQPVVDYAVASVVHLRNPAADDEWFRSYRDSYDTSACAQAGGVARHAQTPMNGRTVFIAGCAGGAFTYHVRLEQGIVVSLTAVGPGRLGDRLAADVGVP